MGHDDARVSALFRPVVTIKVRKNGAGKGVVTSVPAGIACGRVCSEDVVAGTTVTFRARAAKHSRFDHWAGACAIFLAKPTCTLKLNRPAGVIAVFAAEPKR
jgi:hypothetical protein